MHHADASRANSEPVRYDDARPFGYRGGTFSDGEIQEALTQHTPLTLDFSIPGACLNQCSYCGYYAVNPIGKLAKHEIFDVITQFAALGGRSIKILGEGEPLLGRDILETLGAIRDHGLLPVLFTCGDVLGDRRLCAQLHGATCLELGQRLFDLECTVVLKFEAWEQDDIVGRPGFSQLRNLALGILLDLGFNTVFPTRLGFGTVLLRRNIAAIPDVYRFALKHNIYPLVCPLMPVGRSKSREWRDRMAPSCGDTQALAQELIQIRHGFGVPTTVASDFPGGLPCDVGRCGIYVDDIGQVFLCESDSVVGSSRAERLSALWQRADAMKSERHGDARRLGLCAPKRSCGIVC